MFRSLVILLLVILGFVALALYGATVLVSHNLNRAISNLNSGIINNVVDSQGFGLSWALPPRASKDL